MTRDWLVTRQQVCVSDPFIVKTIGLQFPLLFVILQNDAIIFAAASLDQPVQV